MKTPQQSCGATNSKKLSSPLRGEDSGGGDDKIIFPLTLTLSLRGRGEDIYSSGRAGGLGNGNR